MLAQKPRQAAHFSDDGVLHVLGVVPVGQVQQDREPRGAFHERAGGAAVAGPVDRVAFPMARHRAVGDLGGPFARTRKRISS